MLWIVDIGTTACIGNISVITGSDAYIYLQDSSGYFLTQNGDAILLENYSYPSYL
jgi:hypothetical protein